MESNTIKEEEIDKLIERVIRREEEKCDRVRLCEYEGSWYPTFLMKGVISSQKMFKAEDGDIILCSLPKSGTTWLKALIFSVVNRCRFGSNQSPVLTTQPHDLIYGLEFEHFGDGVPRNLDHLSHPRIFATHAARSALPPSIVSNNNVRIVYVCRSPLDNFVSMWHFLLTMKGDLSASGDIEEAFYKYCEGVHPYGPFWDHVLEFWKMSQENPQKVLFVKYEDMKKDVVYEAKRLAAFLGMPFTHEEEGQGLVEEITRMCSFGNLKTLEVNQSGCRNHAIPVSAYFRKGEVGDHANLLTPSMVQTLTKVIQDRFAASGLVF